MKTPSGFRLYTTQGIAALGGISLAVSMLLVGVDLLNHSVPSMTYLAALVISTSITTFAGVWGRKVSPWFGWLAYGVMMGSAILALPLMLAVAFTGKLPNDPSFLAVLVVGLLLFVCAFFAVLVARKQAGSPTSAI